MSRYKTVYTEVEVDVDLSDFDTDDLIEELESRGELLITSKPYDNKELVEQNVRYKKQTQKYQDLFCLQI